MSEELPKRFCISCEYPLDYLSTQVCPECGKWFDPVDGKTYLTAADIFNERWRFYASLGCAIGGLILAVSLPETRYFLYRDTLNMSYCFVVTNALTPPIFIVGAWLGIAGAIGDKQRCWLGAFTAVLNLFFILLIPMEPQF